MKKKNVLWTSMMMLLSANILAACGSSSGGTMSADTVAVEKYAYQESKSEVTLYNNSGNRTEMNGIMEEAEPETENTKVETERKLIRTVEMNVETENYDELMENLEKQIQELGGYIQEKSAYHGSYYGNSRRNADITARIPSEKLELFTKRIGEIGNVTHESESVEDVTLKYVDLDSHKKMLQAEQARLLELLENAQTMEDIIALESRLSEVRYQIESMESQLRTYDNLVDYSTVHLYINEVERYTPQQEKSTWDRIKTGFTENVYNVTNGIKNFVIEFIIAIPVIAVWIVIISLAVFVGRVLRKIKKPKHFNRKWFGKHKDSEKEI